MKKKNGFIAISVIYSFFIVFIAVILAILAEYSYNRMIIKKINEQILNEIQSES